METLSEDFRTFIELLGSEEVEFDGLPLNCIAKEDLARNKAASGRAKDRTDLEELEKLPEEE